jgi:hypothetical protein
LRGHEEEPVLQEWLPYIIISVVALILIAATVVLARLAWRRQVRMFIVDLLGRREAIGAGLNTVDAVVETLSQGSVPELLLFAQEGSEERRAVSEIAARMRIEASELADLALPKTLWLLADRLGAAAASLAEHAGGVGDSTGEAVLDALLEMDLLPVRTSLQDADAEIVKVSEKYSLADSAVYGGGLYI